MKIDKIKKLILDQKGVAILTGERGQQWIGGKDWMVRVDEGLHLTPKSVKGLFDFSVEQMDKLRIEEAALETYPLWPVLRRNVNNMQVGSLNIDNYGGIEMLIFSGKVYLLEQKYIRCAVAREDYREYMLGWDAKDQPLIVINDGMIFAGSARPMPESTCQLLLEQMKFMCSLRPGGTMDPSQAQDDNSQAQDGMDGEQLDMERLGQ
ncbi:MAG: hypothetical protein IKH30_01570 [Clostridia bacterium]|nr:hypothetical protein [Clostridia bacterium]MBR4537237.1 hypothetical protein [Clostridia bacterium]MBR4540532.1 hypothetical protein [Clostridia bacterium]